MVFCCCGGFFFFKTYVNSVLPASQKKTPDPNTDGGEPPCGCWDLNSEPLEEQSVLLTTEPSLQPLKAFS
jgi:hypothetical protein